MMIEDCAVVVEIVEKNVNTISDTQLLNFMIEEMRGKPWFSIFPLFRPMEKFPDGSFQYCETIIDPDTFREHITAAYVRWEKK
jgi:hypothetical protein